MKNGRDMTDYEKIMAEEYGIYSIAIRPSDILSTPQIPKTPKRPVSPYAKFDKFHRKKKRK